MVIYQQKCEALKEFSTATQVRVNLAFDGRPAYVGFCPYRNNITGSCSLKSDGYSGLCDRIRSR